MEHQQRRKKDNEEDKDAGPDDYIDIDTRHKQATVMKTDDDFDMVRINTGEYVKRTKGVTEAVLEYMDYSVFHPHPVGMGAVDEAMLALVGAKVGKILFGRVASWWGARAATEAGYTVENIAGYYVRGSTSITKGVYTKTIQTLAQLEGDATLFQLSQAIEAEAIKQGATKIVIKGIEIVNSKLMNQKIANYFGYSYEEIGKNAIQLIKNLK